MQLHCMPTGMLGMPRDPRGITEPDRADHRKGTIYTTNQHNAGGFAELKSIREGVDNLFTESLIYTRTAQADWCQ